MQVISLLYRQIIVIILISIPFIRANAQVNLNKGLVAYYPFNGTFNDASGNGNHGTAKNGTMFTADQWGNPNDAAFFDGIDDWIDVGYPSFTFRHQFTIAFRYKTTTPKCQTILTKANYTGSPQSLQFQVAFNHPNQSPKGLFLGTNHTGTCLFGPSRDLGDFGLTQKEVAANQWGCAVIVFDSGVKKIYMNGKLELTKTVTGAYPIGVDSCVSPFRMGCWWQGDPLYYSGILDEVRLYDRKLNALEIDSLCNLITVPRDTIINRYAEVLGRGCENSFQVDSATGFAVGDTVLLIQMKGADVDTSNTSSFGSITNLNGAGNYELNVVKAVSGNSISLRYKLLRQYNIPGGRVQIVRVPSFSNYTVNQKHSCLPWNGKKGGVFIIDVANSLTLNNDIDVSGKGFAGGQISKGAGFACDRPDFFYPLSGNDGGQKGEGISEIASQKMRGKGRLGSGGGGGNNANAGGAGGGNAGAGGAGGYQHASCNQTLLSGGFGGTNLPNNGSVTNNRLYPGGGGGCGHENNGNTDPGGNGAGIIIIKAGTLTGNSRFIRANGANCIDKNALGYSGSTADGQSGGGAGGSVLINVNSFVNSPFIETKGGAGGNVYATALHGPGGGGGGGFIRFSNATLSGSNVNVSGGAPGRSVNLNNATTAVSGQSGAVAGMVPFSMPTLVFVPNQITIGFTDTFVSCLTRQFISSVSTTNSGIASYQWSAGSLTSTLKNPLFTFPGKGTYLVKLVVTDSNGCRDSLVKPVVIDYPPFAQASADTSICIGQTAGLSAKGGVVYSWSPAAAVADSTAATTTASPRDTTTYVVTVTDAKGCVDKDTVTVSIIPSPTPITAFPSDTVICNGKSLQLYAINGTSYSWSPAGYLSNPNIANPVATFVGNFRYIVRGTDLSGCLSSDTVNIRSASDPVVDASSDGTAISCDHAGVTLFASGAATYIWSPAEYLDDFRSASPLASPPGTMVFTLTGYDSIGCAGSDTITVFSVAKAKVFLPDAFTPNNDGKNDRIRPIAWCDFRLAEFRIFNRWGQCVFYGYTNEHYWDGSFGGKPAPMDVYGYFIRGFIPSTGKEVLYKGNFTLLR